MTRELKLAMVIGFALLLLVAIVVSDHFSTGGADHSSLVASSQPRLSETAPPVALRRPAGTRADDIAPSAPRAVDPMLAATTAPRSPVRPIGGRPEPGPTAAPLATAAPVPGTSRAVASESGRRGSEPVAPRTHRVAEGESLSSIATAFYGDARLWQRLAEANRERLPDPDRMRVGLVLLIPDAADLGTTPASPSVAPVRDPLVPAASRTHVVGEGETLSEIAARHLGSARRWPEIVAANRDRIDDPDRVLPGTELRLP